MSAELEDGSLATSTPSEVPAAAGSPLASLRERRQARRNKLFLDLKVPGLEPAVYVRYNPIKGAKLLEVNKKLARSKDNDAVVAANVAMLADACVGVFQLDSSGQAISVDPDNLSSSEEEWLKFGPELGALLAEEGEPAPERVVDVVRALFDGDLAITTHGDLLIDWSRTLNEELERDTSGN